MVVTHFNFVGVVIIAPDEANAVLIVDPYAVPAFPGASERFKSITRRKSEVVQNLGRLHYFQFATSSAFYFAETLHGLTIEEALSVLITKRLDHIIVYSAISHMTSKK
jgi:hypothetical protein